MMHACLRVFAQNLLYRLPVWLLSEVRTIGWLSEVYTPSHLWQGVCPTLTAGGGGNCCSRSTFRSGFSSCDPTAFISLRRVCQGQAKNLCTPDSTHALLPPPRDRKDGSFKRVVLCEITPSALNGLVSPYLTFSVSLGGGGVFILTDDDGGSSSATVNRVR